MGIVRAAFDQSAIGFQISSAMSTTRFGPSWLGSAGARTSPDIVEPPVLLGIAEMEDSADDLPPAGRHVFGSTAINKASIVQVQHWMGHADIKTTMRYLHHKSHAADADLLDGAFVAEPSTSGLKAPSAYGL
jgi:integrase